LELVPSPLLDIQERHPENGQRLANMVSLLQRGPIAPLLSWRSPREATVGEMACVHDEAYLLGIQADSQTGKRYGASTVLPQGGWLGVSLAAGAALDAAELVLSGEAKRAFALVRPPGHHSSRAACDGFCFVNNAAVAAQTAASRGHRVAVIDIDVHHGNGTQAIFFERSDVLTVSMHMHQGAWDEGTAHPETGDADEVGAGDGIGFNVNVPLDLASGDSAYLAAWSKLVVPAVDAFAPTFIVVACGVDGSCVDPLGRMLLTATGYFQLARGARALADKHAEGRLVATLEGGYSLSYAAFCVGACAAAFAGVEELPGEDPLLGTYPDPPLRDPHGWRVQTLLSRIKSDRESAIAAARAALS